MSLRLLACLACSAALLLGACSGSNTPGPSNADGDGNNGTNGGGGSNGEDGDDGSNGGDGDMGKTPLEKANDDYMLADEAVKAANAAIEAGNQQLALRLIAEANDKLDAAVTSARAAVTEAGSGSAAAFGAAQRALDRALNFQRTQEAILRNAREGFAWYRAELVRYTFANGVAVTPRDATNTATIRRIERTRIRPGTDDTVEAHPDAFTAATFEPVPYADGKMVFRPSDDEFKVDGYTAELVSTRVLELHQRTGLKLTSGGLVIRTGGTKPAGTPFYFADFTDMRRDITRSTNDTNDDGEVTAADGLPGQNGWDLEITFNEPQPASVRGGDSSWTGKSSWTGNADFYWRSIVRAADSQLMADGKYYETDAFNQPDNFKDLGTYEVWLSNHIGVERNREPTSGSGTYPNDDDNYYLKYAAYGLFIYTADTETFFALTGPGSPPTIRNGQHGRMQSIHYGYSAFADVSGRRTTDIGKAITNGSFRGQTLAYAVKGTSGSGGSLETRLLRGDAALTVTIPKTTGTGAISGTLNNFEEWSSVDGAWARCGQDQCLGSSNNLAVSLVRANILAAGDFSGSTIAAGRTDLNSERGSFRGAVYGPRSDSSDLEVAGSWTVGVVGGAATEWSIMGSFGAKQR